MGASIYYAHRFPTPPVTGRVVCAGGEPYGAAESLRNIQRMMATLNPKVGRVKIADVIDNRFIRKLDESGYIDALYAKSP